MQKRLICWILAICMAASLAVLPARAAESNETKIYIFLRNELGCNTATACGILANIEAECGFNPTAQTSYYYGICQWGGERRQALMDFCGDAYDTLQGQLEYMKHELETNERAAWAKMQGIEDNAGGAYTAGYNWAQYYERCASYHYSARASRAEDYFYPRYQSFAVPTPTVAGFTDVWESAYFADAVRWAVEHGVTKGTTETTFSPRVDCTRAEIVTFLWRAMGSPEPESEVNPFADVRASAYYRDAVLWAVEQGITQGVEDGLFSPLDTVTRAQTVTFLWRMEGEPGVTADNPFLDVPAERYYTRAILWAVQNNVTQGTAMNEFSPADPCTRAETVTFLWRALK